MTHLQTSKFAATTLACSEWVHIWKRAVLIAAGKAYTGCHIISCTWSWLGLKFWLWKEKEECGFVGILKKGTILDLHCSEAFWWKKIVWASDKMSSLLPRQRKTQKDRERKTDGQNLSPNPPSLHMHEDIICTSWDTGDSTFENWNISSSSLLFSMLIPFYTQYIITYCLSYVEFGMTSTGYPDCLPASSSVLAVLL